MSMMGNLPSNHSAGASRGHGMRGVGGGTGRSGGRNGTIIEDQKAVNAAAPRIEHLVRRIAALFKPYTGPLVLTLILVLAGAGLTVIPPLLIRNLFDDALFAPGGVRFDLLVWLCVAMMLLYVGSALLGVWQSYLTARVGNEVMGELRVRLFARLQAMELSFFTKTKTGVIQSRLQNDVGGVANALTNTISSVFGNIVNVVAALVAMFLLNWQLTLIAIVLTPMLAIVQRRVGQVRAKIAAATQESLSEMTSITQETLSVSGILLTKAFNRQRAETLRYSDENRNQVSLQVRQAMSGQWFFALVQVIISAIPVVVYLVAGWLLIGGFAGISAGTIVAFTTVQARLLFPVIGLLRVALDLQTSSALFARIFEYLDLKPAIADAPDAVEVDAQALGLHRPGATGARPAYSPPPAVEFDAVTFRYPDARGDEHPTLEDVSFSIEPGTFAAFVGPSGAGKTTVSYLIPRFYEASSGAVRFAGRDVRELQHESLVAHIGIVSQETYLFHATIAENLRYAKADATSDELENACRQANIHDTITDFPDGYDTVVGERGYRLSGGEKQRVAIARVLLKDPEVLILDEATSALDTISERVVQQALDSAATGRTTIAIAHRLSTIVAADTIFVVAGGRIVERGNHAQLLAAGGTYAALYEQQVEMSGDRPGD